MNTLEFAQRGTTLRPVTRVAKSTQPRLSAEQREAIVNEWMAGKTSGVLARKYKISASYVHALASYRGVKRGRRA